MMDKRGNTQTKLHVQFENRLVDNRIEEIGVGIDNRIHTIKILRVERTDGKSLRREVERIVQILIAIHRQLQIRFKTIAQAPLLADLTRKCVRLHSKDHVLLSMNSRNPRKQDCKKNESQSAKSPHRQSQIIKPE